MVRMRIPESEILKDVQARRLLTPLNAAAEKQLTSDGASAKFLETLKTGDFAVPLNEALALERTAAEHNAAIAREKAADERAFADRYRPSAAQSLPASVDMLRMLDGKLVHREDNTLKPFDTSELRKVHYFAFYYSALWCGPCRQFTPKLVEFYKKTKAQHPEVEVIFVSNDRSASAMEKYMNEDGMPWPAIRYDLIDNSVKKYATNGIPWLIILNDAGVPVFPQSGDAQNPLPRKWSSPEQTLQILAKLENG